MDLSAMLNDGPEPGRTLPPRASTEPGGGRGVLTPLSSSAAAPAALQQQGASSAGRPYNANMTPMQTPSGQYGSAIGQYPFPQQSSLQSQAGLPAQPYRSYDAQPTGASAGRPLSLGGSYPQAPPPQSAAYPPPRLPSSALTLHGPTASLSPTPSSSHRSQTPHSVRQSPLAANTAVYPSHNPHFPAQQQQQSHHSQHSHPSTPLGPPALAQRASYQSGVTSPYHQRTLSNTSTGMLSGSPAQHNPSIGNLVESPSTSHRPMSQTRRTSDYLQSIEREREHSISVSPKTRVPLLDSRHSSQAEGYSVRNSTQLGASVAPVVGGPDHVPTPLHMQTLTQSRLPHLTSSAPIPAMAGDTMAARAQSQTPSSYDAQLATVSAQHPHHQHNHYLHREQKEDTLSAKPSAMVTSSPSLKRPADGDATLVPPARRVKLRKYTERPVWARLRPQNPRCTDFTASQTNGTNHAKHGDRQNGTVAQRESGGHTASAQPHQNAMVPPDSLPQDQPLDRDLILARQLLHPGWEKSFTNSVPIPGITRAVCDWLFERLNTHRDIGVDPLQGAIEIEAKIGTLISTASNQRISYPILSPCVLHPEVNSSFRFESQMDGRQHQQMNQFLNQALVGSMQSGRTKMEYKHIYQTDSFATLAPAGLDALPSVVRVRPDQKPRLRTSTDSKTHEVTARIVKLNLDNLHIYCPDAPYDCRISMNLEVNLLPRSEAEIASFTSRDDNHPQPARKKDRMSYRHLAYSIDLTKVDMSGLPPKYELELELDAGMLREQIARLERREPSAYLSVVEGFLDNAMFLMRQSPAQ